MKKIGFIGQGYVGKNYADDFEKRNTRWCDILLTRNILKTKNGFFPATLFLLRYRHPQRRTVLTRVLWNRSCLLWLRVKLLLSNQQYFRERPHLCRKNIQILLFCTRRNF